MFRNWLAKSGRKCNPAILFFANARGQDLARHVFTMTKKNVQAGVLKGWKEIAQFLGQPASTAQRWAREGMPVEHSGRVVQAYPEKLNLWLGRETHEPVQIATETGDLSGELRRGLAYVRDNRKRRRKS